MLSNFQGLSINAELACVVYFILGLANEADRSHASVADLQSKLWMQKKVNFQISFLICLSRSPMPSKVTLFKVFRVLEQVRKMNEHGPNLVTFFLI